MTQIKSNESTRREPKRNDPCPCGSGKKYKNCCGKVEAKLTQKRHEGLKARLVTSRAVQASSNTPLVSFAKKAFKVIRDAGDSPALSEHNFTQGPIESSKDEKSLEKMIGVDENS